KPVASLAAHLATPADHAAWKLIHAVKLGVGLSQLPASLPVLPAHHIATLDDVRQRFRDLPDAVANTVRLPAECRCDVLPRGRQSPPVKIPPGADATSHLRLLCERALPQHTWRDERQARRRLEEEVRAIARDDLAPYFLLLAEIAGEARRRNWPL